MSNFVKYLTLAIALLTTCDSSAQTLPKVVDINESTREASVKVGDYLRVTCGYDYYLFFVKDGKLSRGEPVKERRSILLRDPDRHVTILKILSSDFDTVQIYCGINVAYCLMGSISVADELDGMLLPAEFFTTVKHNISIHFMRNAVE